MSDSIDAVLIDAILRSEMRNDAPNVANVIYSILGR
jgi:hypothetical protein